MLSDQLLLKVLDSAKDATAVYDSPELHIRFANAGMLTIWGKGRNVVGKTFAEAIPEAAGQPFEELLKSVWQRGQTYQATDTPATLVIDGLLKTSFFDFVYEAVLNDDGETIAILHTAVDVTERRLAWQQVLEKQRREDDLLQELSASNRKAQAVNQHLTGVNEELVSSNQRINLLNERLQESETDFKRLVEQAPVAILVFRGPELVIELANPAILEILHKDASIIGKPILESMPELKGEPAVELIFEVFRTGKGFDGNEAPVQMMRDGLTETRYFNFSYRPLLDNGVVVGVMDIAVEVTEQVLFRQRLEAIIAEKNILEGTLRANEQRLQSILDTMAEGVGIIDTQGQMVYANPMAQRILGLAEKDILDRTFDDARWQNLRIDGTPLPDGEHPMAVTMRTGLPIYDQEIAVQPPKGERFYVSINAAPLFDEKGQLTGGIGTFMDVTNRRKLMMQKDDFISVASHELKTPVTTLKASLQLLSRLQPPEGGGKQGELIAQANKSLDKLTGLINDLLNTNRISQGQFQLHRTTFSVKDMINECCQHVRTIGHHEVRLLGALDARVIGDAQQLEQVLVNLVNNAVKYAPESREIVIEVTQTTTEVRIAVTDQGPGIPIEQQPRLFDRYYRTDYSGVRFSGLGLGLYICAEIVRKHGGEIGVNSEPGKGSTFWFTVPAAT